MAREEGRLSYHALVLGWAGSTRRQLRLAAKVHRERGAEVVLAAPRILDGMGTEEGFRPQGWEVAAEMLAQRSDRWVVHSFSNGGFMLFAAVLEALPPRFGLRAALLDSAPGFPERIRPKEEAPFSAMAMMPSLLTALGRPPALTHPWLTPPMTAFMRFWWNVRPGLRSFAEGSLPTVEAGLGPCPVTLIHGDRDPLVRPARVEAYARRLGDQARAVRFDGVDHVRGLLRQPKRYREEVDALLARAALSARSEPSDQTE